MGGQPLVLTAGKVIALEDGLLAEDRASSVVHHMLRLVAPRRGRLLLGGGHRHQRAAPLQEPRRLDGDKDEIGNFSAAAASAPLHEPRRLDGDKDGIGNFSTAAASNLCLKSQEQSTRIPKEEEEERTNQSKAVERKGERLGKRRNRGRGREKMRGVAESQ